IEYPWHVDQGQGALRAWLTLERGEIRQATADLALSGVSARFDDGLAPLRLASVSGRLQGGSANCRYPVVARDLAIGIEDGAAVVPSDFELAWIGGKDAGGSLSASAIELEPLAQLAASLPLPDRTRRRVSRRRRSSSIWAPGRSRTCPGLRVSAAASMATTRAHAWSSPRARARCTCRGYFRSRAWCSTSSTAWSSGNARAMAGSLCALPRSAFPTRISAATRTA